MTPSRTLTNTAWIISEKVLRLLAGVIVGLWVARYLGPDQFGVLSFGVAWIGLFGAIATLGLPHIVTRELVSNPERAGEILGTTGALRLIAAALSFVVAIAVFGILFGFTDYRFGVVALAATSPVLGSADFVEYWSRSRVEWHYAFRARVGALALSNATRVLLILSERGVEWFAALLAAEALLTSLLFLWQARKHGARPGAWRVSWGLARRVLRDSLPILASSAAITVYMKIDQVMIGALLPDAQLGVYSVAVRISALWYVIPVALAQSAMPGIVSVRRDRPDQYLLLITRLIAVSFWLSVAAGVVMTLLGPWIVPIVLGEEYLLAGSVLSIHFWAGVFVAVGVAVQQWYIAENRLSIEMYRTFAGAVVNLVLNAVMIPRFGIQGAAVATVASQFVAAYFSACWFSSARTPWRLLNRGIAYPIMSLAASAHGWKDDSP